MCPALSYANDCLIITTKGSTNMTGNPWEGAPLPAPYGDVIFLGCFCPEDDVTVLLLLMSSLSRTCFWGSGCDGNSSSSWKATCLTSSPTLTLIISASISITVPLRIISGPNPLSCELWKACKTMTLKFFYVRLQYRSKGLKEIIVFLVFVQLENGQNPIFLQGRQIVHEKGIPHNTCFQPFQ